MEKRKLCATATPYALDQNPIWIRIAAMVEEVIPVLRVKDAAVAIEWYRRLGFIEEWVHRFEPDFPAFVSIARGKLRLFLSEHEGDARPETLVYMLVEDVSGIAREFEAPIEEEPWAHEVKLTDPDGNRLRIGAPWKEERKSA